MDIRILNRADLEEDILDEQDPNKVSVSAIMKAIKD
jgi:hypothetical protein